MGVSVIFDNELKARVFQVRDTERYTNSTKTSLEIEYLNNRTDYVTVNLTATVTNPLGNSSVAFYCDDELIGVATYVASDTETEITAHVPYGYHKYYAKYLGNVQCLSSKSGIVELEVTEPNLPKTKFTTTVSGIDSNNWASSISDIGFSIYLKTLDDTNLDGKTVIVTLDDTTTENITTSNGRVNLTGSSVIDAALWTNGEHTLHFEFEGDVGYIGSETDIKINIGYIVLLTRRYAKLGLGDTEIFDVNVSKPDGTPVEGVDVTLQRVS